MIIFFLLIEFNYYFFSLSSQNLKSTRTLFQPMFCSISPNDHNSGTICIGGMLCIEHYCAVCFGTDSSGLNNDVSGAGVCIRSICTNTTRTNRDRTRFSRLSPRYVYQTDGNDQWLNSSCSLRL